MQKIKRLKKLKRFWVNENPKEQKSRNKKTFPDFFDNVPEIVIERLPVYIRILSKLQKQGKEKINSKNLGELSGISPTIIRKDLNYFGGFGKQGVGYQIKELKETLTTILGLDGTWNVGVIGLGRLGNAIASYKGFANAGFRIVALFDTNKSLHGNKIGKITIS